MKILRLVILALIICNISGIIRFAVGEALGSTLSYLSFGLLLFYYFLAKKHKLSWPLVLFGLTFFIISGFIDIPSEKDFYVDFAKYLILIICGSELARNTSTKELMLFHVIGAISILMHALFFIDDYGRYSGFFTDPNEAGFVCLLAFTLAFSIKNETLKIFVIFLSTFCGILTFSRTFLIIWIILTGISIVQSRRNFKILGIGIGVMIFFFSVSYFFELNTFRFSFIEGLLSSGVDSSNLVNLNSRSNVWSLYYDDIATSPLFGNGYLSLAGIEDIKPGVHNSYLRILGEAGIIPFFIFIGTYFYIFKRSIKVFRSHPYFILVTTATTLFLVTNHTFSANKNIIFITIWLYVFAANQFIDDEIIVIDDSLDEAEN